MELLKQIEHAGIVGCGGAGFPTHVKFNCSVNTLIVNGAECEPLLKTDQWLMKHRAAQIIAAAELCGRAVGAQKMYIALKQHYTQAIQSLRSAISEMGSKIELFLLPNFYPAGDEQLLTLEVTGSTVPPAGLPREVGVVVSNVATMCAIYDAAQGEGFTHKYLTVTGQVPEPAVVRVPLGTSFMDCIAAVGGVVAEDNWVLCGGPMMGKLYSRAQAEQQVVTKTTSGLIVLPANNPLVQNEMVSLRAILRQAKTACIQCSQCTDLCPRHLSGHPLQPHKIMRKLAYTAELSQLEADPDASQVHLCSECGVCELYACPMGLRPRQVNVYVKKLLQESGKRYTRTQNSWSVSEQWGWRKIPPRRIAARLGMMEYDRGECDTLITPEIRRVRLPLKQHIGAPAVSAVDLGERVVQGQRIANCPEGALGAHLCASIDGIVTAIDDAITIERGDGDGNHRLSGAQ